MSLTLSWEDYTGDPTVTGSTRIWRYRLNPTSGSSSHLACSKIALGSNSLSATISSTGAVENITSDENAFAWFYIGDNKNLFFFNGRYYDAQPKKVESSTWVEWDNPDENYKSGTKYTLNTNSGRFTTSGGALNFSDFEFANTSLTANDYVSLTGLVTTDGGSTSIGLYYWNGKFYTSAPTASSGWMQIPSSENYHRGTMYDTSGNSYSGNLYLSTGVFNSNGSNYYLSNNSSYYVYLYINGRTVYYFRDRFYTVEPTAGSRYAEVTSSYTNNSTVMNLTDGFYSSRGYLYNINGGYGVGSGTSRYYEAYFGSYTLGTSTVANGGASRGPYTCYQNYNGWSYAGSVSNGNATINFSSGNGGDSIYAYIPSSSFTAPSSSYYASGTYGYTYSGTSYRIIISNGRYSSHESNDGYSLSAPDEYASGFYYYSSGTTRNRIIISNGNYSSHEHKSIGYKYQAQGNFLDGEFITNENEYASIYKYIFSNGFFSKIQVQKETVDQTEHSFSTPTSGSYTDFYMWTKTADISTSASGSPLGERNLLFKNNSNGKIGLYFNSSGHLIRVRSMGSTDYTNFLMFRCRSKWNEDTEWDDDFGLVFINGYLLKTNTTLSN